MLPPYLSELILGDIIDRGLLEDVGTGDVTTEAIVGPGIRARGVFLAKQKGVLAGLHVAERVFGKVDDAIQIQWSAKDGDRVEQGTVFGTVEGPAHSLLVGERLALNFLQRMSGIATMTSAMVAAAHPHRARILDTRKTAPGLRLIDKWAVKLGGGENHRIGLYDMILIKDNHITAAGGIRQAIEAARAYLDRYGRSLLVEVEARTLEEVRIAVETGGVQYILLDNMVRPGPNGAIDTSMLAEAVRLVAGRIETEASGNVTLETVGPIAATGVDFISCGALTHSVSAMDISLKIELTGS